jgi:hypothetical protein
VEFAVVILILVLLIAGGLAALILGGEAGSASLPGWAGRRLSRPTTSLGARRVIDVAPDASKPVASRYELAAREETNVRLDALASEIRSTLASGDDRALQLNAQLEALHRGVQDRLDLIARDSNERWAELANRQALLEARQEAATERLRADLALHFVDHERKRVEDRYSAERATVAAELYAMLARLEAAIAAVTNPVLLPGEPYAPPNDFLPEALVWDNWKEVGERAFDFADLFSARRLYLSEATRGQAGAFVGEMRTLLTESIYPNLRPNASPAQRDRLRQALGVLAVQFPEVRACFERDFREHASSSQPSGDEPAQN